LHPNQEKRCSVTSQLGKKEGAADPALSSCSVVKTTTLNHHTILLIGVFDDYVPCCEQTSRYSLKMINRNNYSFFMNNRDMPDAPFAGGV
tara:strand:+ start:348 stop:617 length:270 start_codon:yes stop_codon:yes gene_type:complete